jgi:N-carbamoyl-L-amino-acid hydrolase
MKSISIVDKKTTFGSQLEKFKYKGDKMNRLSPDAYKCMLEMHIEQGPILEDAGNEIGVVDCVLGMFNYRISFTGQAAHAGTFPMKKRKDALHAAASALCYLHEEIDKIGDDELVYTTGEIMIHPCIHTVIPDYVEFSFDARHEKPEVLKKVLAVIKTLPQKEWARCKCEVREAWKRDTVYWDKKLVGYVEESVKELGVKYQYIHSGAGHDAQFTSYMIPTTMIFVVSKGGLSHCEPEFTSDEQCTNTATVLLNTMLKVDAE